MEIPDPRVDFPERNKDETEDKYPFQADFWDFLKNYGQKISWVKEEKLNSERKSRFMISYHGDRSHWSEWIDFEVQDLKRKCCFFPTWKGLNNVGMWSVRKKRNEQGGKFKTIKYFDEALDKFLINQGWGRQEKIL